MVTKQVLIHKGLPEEFLELNFFEEMLNFKKLADNWIEDTKGVGLYLRGKEGTGKSFLGCYIVKTLLEKNIPARRITHDRLYSDYKDNYQKMPSLLYKQDYLFLDDLLPHKAQKMLEDLISLLKFRKERRYPTIISSNYAIDTFPKSFSDVVKVLYVPLNMPDINFRLREYAGAKLHFNKFLKE
jgi:DNA replication protein DnaC